MDNEKNLSGEGASISSETDFSAESSAPRARNRTVMLTPDITGQVRARIQHEIDTGSNEGGPAEPSHSGFAPVGRGRVLSEPSADFRSPRTPAPAAQSYQAPVVPPSAAPASAAKEGIAYSKKTPVVGFLVSFDSDINGDVYELRAGRLIVTSEVGAGGNSLVIKDESVSPSHAIMRISQGGEIQVLDQLSEFGTRIRRFGTDSDKELSGEKSTLEHGDLVTFGKRKFHVCIVPVTTATEG